MGFYARFNRTVTGAAVGAAFLMTTAAVQAQEKVRVALGDIVSVEMLAFVIALERAKDRGVDYELTSFAEEELATQAIVGGQADLGVGNPYPVIQKTKVPIRVIYQLSTLVFYPIVTNEYQSWKDLDGKPFTFHARGSGTEAIGNIIAAQEGIEFGQRNYLPGSDNRIVALLNGTIDATILDLSNKNILMAQAADRFHILPSPDQNASDELLFANKDWLDANRESADVIVEELLKLWREMSENPEIVEEERAKRNLLADQPQEILAETAGYYKEGTEAGVYDPSGGGAEAAKLDFTFYVLSGQLEGPAESLTVEDYWDLGPLDAARQKLGG